MTVETVDVAFFKKIELFTSPRARVRVRRNELHENSSFTNSKIVQRNTPGVME